MPYLAGDLRHGFPLGVMLFPTPSGAMPFCVEPGIPAQSGAPASPLAAASPHALMGLMGRMVKCDPLLESRTADEVLAAPAPAGRGRGGQVVRPGLPGREEDCR